MAKNIVAKLKGIKERDVKNSDWDDRLEGQFLNALRFILRCVLAQNSDGNSDSEDEGGENLAEELTPEEKLAQVELEKLREIEEMEKEKKMADIKAGRAFAEQTIQPMSDPASSDEDSNPPLLGEYEAEDLTNNLPKKQKEKAIKNTVPDHLNKPQFSDSSDSEGGDIVDPTMYDPRDLQPFSQSTNPELTNNVMELTQNRIRQKEKIAAERRAASLAEAMESKEEPHEDVKMEPMEDNPLLQERLTHEDIKSEIKSEPNEDTKPIQQDLKSSEITNKTDINILNPIAGAIHVPKFKQQPRHNKTNPLGKCNQIL